MPWRQHATPTRVVTERVQRHAPFEAGGPGAVHPAVIADSSRFVTVFRAMRRLIIILFSLLLASPTLSAQQGQGAVRGTVEDSSGAVVAGAVVRLVDASGAVVAEVKTDLAGAFTFDPVRPGSYQARAEFPGFDPAVQPVSVVNGRRATVPKLVLQVAGITQDVVVQREPNAVTAAADSIRTPWSWISRICAICRCSTTT